MVTKSKRGKKSKEDSPDPLNDTNFLNEPDVENII